MMENVSGSVTVLSPAPVMTENSRLWREGECAGVNQAEEQGATAATSTILVQERNFYDSDRSYPVLLCFNSFAIEGGIFKT